MTQRDLARAGKENDACRINAEGDIRADLRQGHLVEPSFELAVDEEQPIGADINSKADRFTVEKFIAQFPSKDIKAGLRLSRLA